MELASQKFAKLEGFRGEERLQDIARGVFFTEDGRFDAPKSKEEAFNRAKQFGATQEEAESVSGHIDAPATPKAPSTETQVWSRQNPDGTWEETWKYKGETPEGEGWLPQKKASDPSTAESRLHDDAREYISTGEPQKALALLASWFLNSRNPMTMAVMDEQDALDQARLVLDQLYVQLGVVNPLLDGNDTAGDGYSMKRIK